MDVPDSRIPTFAVEDTLKEFGTRSPTKEPLMTTEQTGHATNLSNSAPFVELAQSLASRTGSISTVVDQVMRFMKVFMGKFGAGLIATVRNPMRP
jgi:hypothetical protein